MSCAAPRPPAGHTSFCRTRHTARRTTVAVNPYTLLAPVAAVLLFAAAACAPATVPERGLRTRNVILLTIDGMRIQELFGGMDPVVAREDAQSNVYYASDLESARSLYWKDSAEERRRALMPFFWGTLAQEGIVLGNKEKGSQVKVKNEHLFSSPGYVEIFTGQPRPEVASNDLIRYPYPTVLEFAQRELGLGWTDVASIGSWKDFNYLTSSKENAFFVNGGHQSLPEEIITPRMKALTDVQDQIMTLWPETRSDAVTFEIALEYLAVHRPRVFHLGLGEPDDWAHGRRYDRYLDYIHVFDGYLERLWRFIQASDHYRDRTTLVITIDHGRGVTLEDWAEHGEGIAGSEDIWIAILGPDTDDVGEAGSHPTVYQADVAATLLQYLGLDYRVFDPQAGPPITIAFSGGSHPARQASRNP
jgi:hypothetical protein